MCTEIEAKLKVDSLQKAAEALPGLGAEFLYEQLQRDYYFDDADTTFIKTDRCLRLRRQLIGGEEKVFLTYKGPKQQGRLKRRQEIEIELSDGDLAEKLLLAVGYEKILVFEKKRRTWRLGRCEIALDELPLLGCFVEIEGPDEESITRVQIDLGLKALSHIVDSYAVLMENELCRLGKAQREVLF